MNNFLFHKNEEGIRKNSADFYIMTIYSKYILKLDDFRLKNFIKFKDRDIRKQNFFEINKNKYKPLSTIGISCVLTYYFKSILIIPLFFSSYLILNKLFTKDDYTCNCFFCTSNLIKLEKLKKYENYYKLIDKSFDANPNITSIKDFELEIEKILKKMKIE
jgi:hypothetical protein